MKVCPCGSDGFHEIIEGIVETALGTINNGQIELDNSDSCNLDYSSSSVVEFYCAECGTLLFTPKQDGFEEEQFLNFLEEQQKDAINT